MKIFFINNGTTHYYNLVLNKLSRVKDLQLTVIVPDGTSSCIGEGVYQTRENILFRVIELPEYAMMGKIITFRGLASLLLKERPDAVIFADIYLYSFVLNVPVVAVTRLLGIKLIMKSIPFRLPTYIQARKQVEDKKGASALLGWFMLALRRMAYNVPHAHVNYIDAAREVYGSYGVPAKKIFVTRNSPDTDALLIIKAGIKPNLPPCRYRLIHVGRLVAWKRVDLLIRAFSRILPVFPDAELLVVGSGPDQEQLETLADKLNLGTRIRFLGGIYDPRLLGQYLISSSIYVLPGMGGLSINEAMCFGLPVICSVGDGTEKFLVRDGVNGKYFKDGDEADLVEKIKFLFQRPYIMTAMGIESERIIQDEVNIHTVIDGYRRALSFALNKTYL